MTDKGAFLKSIAAAVCQEVRIGRVLAPNRLALAPLTNCQSETDGTVGADEVSWLKSRARSGFGTVVTSALSVHPSGRTWARQAATHDDRFIPSLRELAATRGKGTVMLAQLFHGGLRADKSIIPERWGPSASDGVSKLDAAMIETLTQSFVDAAARASKAGFNGVEIHGAHGYLPAQFLSREENLRCDPWGGSVVNRAKFLVDIVRRIRASQPDTVIQVRLSAEDMRQSRGIDLDETAEIAGHVVEAGADSISLSVWDIGKPSQKYPTVGATEFVRQRLDNRVPLTTAGKIWTSDDLARALDQGADQIAVGRLAIFNPDAASGLVQPDWLPQRPPLTRDQLRQLNIHDGFIDYLSVKWPDYVS